MAALPLFINLSFFSSDEGVTGRGAAAQINNLQSLRRVMVVAQLTGRQCDQKNIAKCL